MQQSGGASRAQWGGNGSVSIKVSKWNIAVLHSGLEPRGESGIHTCMHARRDTHLHLHRKVNTITAESTPIFVSWHRGVRTSVSGRENERYRGTDGERERQAIQPEKGFMLAVHVKTTRPCLPLSIFLFARSFSPWLLLMQKLEHGFRMRKKP